MNIKEGEKKIIKANKFSRTLNINKKINLKGKPKSFNKFNMKLTKPIKIKTPNKFKNTQIIKDIKNITPEKEIDASIEDFIVKEIISPNNLKKNNTTIFGTKHYIRVSDNSPFRTIKNIKTQIVANDMHNTSNVINYQFINGGNGKNNQGTNNLNITVTNKTPIKLKKINMDKKYRYGTDYQSTTFDKKENQLNSFYNNNNKNIYNNTELINNKFTNEGSNIIIIKKEIEKLKKENIYQETLINDMKQQLDNIKKEKDAKTSNGTSTIVRNNNIEKLKQELGIKNNKLYEEDINYNSKNNNIKNNSKMNFNNKDDLILFDKLKLNYSNNKNVINELINENEVLNKKIKDIKIIIGNKKRNNSYLLNKQKKDMSFNILSKEMKKEFDNNINDNNNNINYEDDKENIISNYIENSLKSKNQPINFKNEKMIDIKQKNNVKLMIKMTLNSNNFPEEEIISLFMNNLLNYSNSIDIFMAKYMRTGNLLDKEILQDYFKSIFFDDNDIFNINNIFNEIKEFYDEETKNLQNIQINELISQKKNNFIQIVEECQFIDTLKTGLIEINQFKNILDKYKFYQLFNENENKLFNILIYNMKKNINKEKIGLFYLFYYNLCDNLDLKDSLIKDNISNNNSSIIDRNEGVKKTSFFHKENGEKKVKETVDESLNRKLISNVDFRNNQNTKERGSDNSSNTYAYLSSHKFSFDYSSKSGSKEDGYLKEGIKEVISNYMESDEYIETLCKDFVDNIFNVCIEEIKSKQKIY